MAKSNFQTWINSINLSMPKIIGYLRMESFYFLTLQIIFVNVYPMPDRILKSQHHTDVVFGCVLFILDSNFVCLLKLDSIYVTITSHRRQCHGEKSQSALYHSLLFTEFFFYVEDFHLSSFKYSSFRFTIAVLKE